MTRRLIILRHAKSSWKDAALADYERPLNKRGRNAAPKVGARIAELGWCPQYVLCSGAARTRETIERMRDHFERAHVDYTDALYDADVASDVSAIVRSLPDNVETAMVVGHNPVSEEAVEWLTGQRVVLKTANAALLEGAGASWADAATEPGAWSLVDVIVAREL